ncbi:MAG: hypothetical protein WCO75_09700 [Planctomycetota bacterium]
MKPLQTGTLAFLICRTAIGNDLPEGTQATAPTPVTSQVVEPQHAAAPTGGVPANTPEPASAKVPDAQPAELPIIDPHGFSLDFRPQIWMPSVSGSVGVGGRTANVEESFIDILQNTDSVIGLSGRLTMTYDRFEAYTDITWMRLGFDKVTTPSGARFSTTMSLMISDACIAYNLIDPSVDDRGRRGPTLAPYVGARIFWANTKVDASDYPFSDSASSVWADPIFGGMWETPFGDAGRFSIAGDAGGFTLSSQLTWQATALVGFDFRCLEHPSTLSIGMRAIADNYTSDNAHKVKADLILWGPIIAWDIRF